MLESFFDRFVEKTVGDKVVWTTDVERKRVVEDHREEVWQSLMKYLQKHDEKGEKTIMLGTFEKILQNISGYQFQLNEAERKSIEALFSRAGKVRYEDLMDGIRALFGKGDLERFASDLRVLAQNAYAHGIDYSENFSKHDTEKNGRISEKKFRTALKDFGVKIEDSLLDHIVNVYRDQESKGSIKYNVFLNDIIAGEQRRSVETEEKLRIAKMHSDNVDVMDKLQEFTYALMEHKQEGHHEIWMALEQFDKDLSGTIDLEHLGQAFQTLGLNLSSIDKRRLQSRFKAQEHPNGVRYRDLLSAVLQPPGLAKKIARGNEMTNSSSSLGFWGEMTEYGSDKGGLSNVALESARKSSFTNNLELISPQELQAILEKLFMLAKEGEDFEHIDLRDVFEQFDYELSGNMSRSDFFLCMQWLGFSHDAAQNPAEAIRIRNLMSRLANNLELPEDPDVVSYRKLFLMLHHYEQELQRKEDMQWREAERGLHDLLEAVRQKVSTLKVSGIDFVECFKSLDPIASGCLSYRDFQKALELIGIRLPLVSLSTALKSLESTCNTSYRFEDEVKVSYTDFARMVHSSIEKHAEEQSAVEQLLSNPSSTIHVKLNDRFEVVRALRKYICEAVQFQGNKESVVRACFDDLDFKGEGVVHLEDLREGMRLLGVSASEQETRRVMDFPYLFRNPGRDDLSDFVGPRNPKELSKAFSSYSNNRFYELTYDAFRELVGINLGVDSILDGLENDLPQAVEAHPREEEGSTLCSFAEFLAGREETHVGLEELLELLYHAWQKTPHRSVDNAYEAFEQYDLDLVDKIEQEEARQALKQAFGLRLSETEAHRLLRRLEVLTTQVIPLPPPLSSRSESSQVQMSPRAKRRYEVEPRQDTKLPAVPINEQVLYRKLLLQVFSTQAAKDSTKTGQEDVQLDLLVQYLRQHKDVEVLLEKLGKLGVTRTSRKEMFDLLKPYCEDQTLNEMHRLLRLLRVFEAHDGAIDPKQVFQLIRLDLEQSKVDALMNQVCSKPADRDTLMQQFGAHDPQFSGVLPTSLFLQVLRTPLEKINFRPEDVEKLCNRFRSISENVELSKRQTEQMPIDYRAMMRYLMDCREEQLKMAPGTVRRVSMEKVDFALQWSEERHKWKADKQIGKLWDAVWELPGEGSAGSNVGFFEKLSAKKKLTFKAWRIRKDFFEFAKTSVFSLSPTLCQNEKAWSEVGIALAAISLLVRIMFPREEIPTLRGVFVEWSKEKEFTFTKEDGGCLCYSKDPKDANSEDNKEFVGECKRAWAQCEKKVKEKLLQCMFRINKQRNEAAEPQQEAESAMDNWKGILMMMGVKRLHTIVQKGKTADIKAQKEKKRQDEHENGSCFQKFVRKKDCLRVRLPNQKLRAGVTDPILCRLFERAAGAKYVFTTTKRELLSYRQALCRAGFVFKENFINEDGELDSEQYRVMKEKQLEERANASAEHPARRHGASRQFGIWAERKRALEQAIQFLKDIDTPALMVGSSAERESTWKRVGKALKGIDAGGLQKAFLRWSKGYANKAKCIATWNSLPPKSFSTDDVQGLKWNHLRSVLQKLVSKSVHDYAYAFEEMLGATLEKQQLSSKQVKMKLANQALKGTSAEHFHMFLSFVGISLRLHESKRIMEFFPGTDELGYPQENCVSLERFFQVISGEEKPVILAQLGNGNNNQSEGQNLSEGGRVYALSLEDKIQRGLKLAGAPKQLCQDVSTQRIAMQQSLIHLSALSRANRLQRKEDRAKSKLIRVPGRPKLTHDVTKSTATSLHLQWSREKMEDEVLFFSLEMVKPVKQGEGGGFDLICQDPPTLSSPPIAHKGEYTVTNLKPNTRYEFRLIAFNQHGPSKASRVIFSTLPETPKTPSFGKIRCEGKFARCLLSWGPSLDKIQPPVAVLPDKVHETMGVLKATERQSVALSASATSLATVNGGDLGSLEGTIKSRGEIVKETQFELVIAQRGMIPSTQGEIGTILYRGQSAQCDVVGMRAGFSYEFCVRALNCFGEPTPVTPVCRVTPLLPPSKPSVTYTNGVTNAVGVQWKTYDSMYHGRTSGEQASDDGVLGALANWTETVRKWERNGTGSYTIQYLLEVVSSDKATSKRVIESSSASCQVVDLLANTKYQVRVKMRCTVRRRKSKDGSCPVCHGSGSCPCTACQSTNVETSEFVEEKLESPWSSFETFWTPPEPPSQPITVSATSTVLVFRWYPPVRGAKSYLVEYQEVSTENHEVWTLTSRGSNTLAVIPGLAPGKAYRVRVTACGETELQKSRPSLLAQHETLESEEYKMFRPTPERARFDFKIPCAARDLVLGDMVLFSEKANLPCYRTIAGRVVAIRKSEEQSGKKTGKRSGAGRNQFWLQVEWCTVSSAKHRDLEFLVGSRIQRKETELFRLEVELGVYRMPWVDEAGRWSRKEEEAGEREVESNK